MGDTFSAEKEQSFLERIDYFQPADDPNYGKLQVYRMKQPPYEYVLDHRKTFVEDQDRLQAYLRQAKRLKQIQHKNLAKVHAVVLREDKQLCIIHRVVHTYSSFYNFTLAQAIGKKKLTRNTFPQGDLIYVMHSLIDAVTALKRCKLAFGQFRTESVYLSPEGHVKLYLMDLDQDNKHSAFYRVLGEQQKMNEYLLAPEQLAAVRKMEYDMRFSVWKADLFAVGMVMLELITLDSANFYYNEQRMDVMLSKAVFSLDVHQGKYSVEFVQIIKDCLQGDPHLRPQPEDVLERLEEMRGGGRMTVYCIRLQAQQNKEKKEEDVVKPKGQFILNSLAKKLNPSPISTISSSSASLFRTGEVKSWAPRGKNEQLFRE